MWDEIVRSALDSEARVYERNPRKGLLQPRFLRHRFPVKGGMTLRGTMIDRMMQGNSLLAHLKVHHPQNRQDGA